MAKARENWKAKQAAFDPGKLIFIDETGANTKMVRLHGRSGKGTRLKRIGTVLNEITQQECAAYIKQAGYAPAQLGNALGHNGRWMRLKG